MDLEDMPPAEAPSFGSGSSKDVVVGGGGGGGGGDGDDDDDCEKNQDTMVTTVKTVSNELSITGTTYAEKEEVDEQSGGNICIRFGRRICGKEDPRNVAAFFLLGLFNNIVFVINNAGAGDIAPGNYALIYICNIFPTLIVKLTGPYWFHYVPYNIRIIISAVCISLSFILVMYGQSEWLRLVGVAFGAVQGGLGEATLLGSAALYTDPVICLAMWSSGTGFAGPAGYIVEIFIMKKAVAWVRVVVGQIIVGIFLFSYFGILKAPPQGWPTKETRANETTGTMTTKERFKHVLMLWPYMIPLFIVYFAEYLIQAGAWTSYSFDPSQVSIPENRDEAYLWLNFLYQWGVFISRSSTILFVLNRTALWIIPFLQIGMLLLFSFNATHQFWNGLSLLVPAFITGLLGGGVYVNAFTLISKEVEQAYVEFSLSAASVADTLGIIGGDILAMFLQGCIYQQLGFANQADVTCPFA